jgi:hypothetical protein
MLRTLAGVSLPLVCLQVRAKAVADQVGYVAVLLSCLPLDRFLLLQRDAGTDEVLSGHVAHCATAFGRTT